MSTTPNEELDELPEFTDDMAKEFQALRHVDLHLGAAPVQDDPWLKNPEWWIKRYGPKPSGPGIFALDVLIILLTLVVIDLIVLSWMFVFG